MKIAIETITAEVLTERFTGEHDGSVLYCYVDTETAELVQIADVDGEIVDGMVSVIGFEHEPEAVEKDRTIYVFRA